MPGLVKKWLNMEDNWNLQVKEKACVPVKWSLKDEKIPQDIPRSLEIEDVQIILNFRQIRNIVFLG